MHHNTLRILITGSHGLIGSALSDFLTRNGHHVHSLVRSVPDQPRQIQWQPEKSLLPPDQLEGFDAVVHLAGESIAQRWTPAKKELIRTSRVDSTRLLTQTLNRLAHPPEVFACASACGYYGDRGDELLTEDSTPGTGFLATLCRDWEAAAQPAARNHIRVLSLRFGVVLSPHGGALAKMLNVFHRGLGGKIGSGRQFMSWITLDDLVRAIFYTILTKKLSGPVNLVSPNPVTNAQLTQTLGRVLHRPTLMNAPAFALRLLMGQMARETLLASQRISPKRLTESGFKFHFEQLEPALRHLLTPAQP